LRLLFFIGSLLLNIGAAAKAGLEEVGRNLLLFGQALRWMVRRPFRIREVLRQFDFVGVQSLELIVITGAFTGMVLTLQAHIAMERYEAESLIGAAVALSLSRELGPVLSALMVVGRAGSAIAAELGTMRNTQQIDALASMAVEPVQYLVVPRVLAVTLVMPMLTILFEFSGMVAAYLTVVHQLGLEGATFMNSVREYMGMDDIMHGLVKSTVFGLILSVVCCTKGFFVTGGAQGVARATTRAVVVSSLLILASDYFMTALMLRTSS